MIQSVRVERYFFRDEIELLRARAVFEKTLEHLRLAVRVDAVIADARDRCTRKAHLAVKCCFLQPETNLAQPRLAPGMLDSNNARSRLAIRYIDCCIIRL